MVEKITNNIESGKYEALEALNKEKIGELDKDYENKEAEKPREDKEVLANEALEIARQHEKAQEEASASKPETNKDRPLTKKDVEASYNKPLSGMQKQLSAPSRAFSKFIHNPVVEKTSDAVGNTVARPNLIIAGAIGAIASCIIYVIAKKYGYILSGSETIALFVAGWSVGAVIEYARVGLLNKRNG